MNCKARMRIWIGTLDIVHGACPVINTRKKSPLGVFVDEDTAFQEPITDMRRLRKTMLYSFGYNRLERKTGDSK